MRYHASSHNVGYGSYPQGEQKGQPFAQVDAHPHRGIGLEELLQLLTAGFGTFRPIDRRELRSANWGIAEALGVGS